MQKTQDRFARNRMFPKMRVIRCLLAMGILILGLTLGMTCRKKDLPPNAPSIPSGPTSGRRGDTLRFSTVAEDPDGDSVAVRFDWGDSTMSDWSALVRSGDSVVMTHVWQRLATYSIRTQARDTKDTASVWSGEHQLSVASFSMTFGGFSWDEGYSVQQTSDGGYVIAGYTTSYGSGEEDVWLIKTDASGNKVWDRTFGGPDHDEGGPVEQTSDGGYIITGFTSSFGAGGDDVWLIKTDADGNKVWDKTFGGADWDWGNSVRQTSDEGYIIAGCTMSFGAGSEDVWLIKTDATGNEVWNKIFGGTGMDGGASVEQASDRGYIVTGYTRSYGADSADVWLIKTDSDGNKVWDKTFGGTNEDWGSSVQQTSDGGYVVTGATDSYGAGGYDVWLIRTDAAGNEVWDKTFGGTGWDEGSTVQQTPDGGCIVAGSTSSLGSGGIDVWLIKTDADGNKLWDNTFGGKGDDEGMAVERTSDGGYVVTGSTAPYSSANFDVWLIKTDADGN